MSWVSYYGAVVFLGLVTIAVHEEQNLIVACGAFSTGMFVLTLTKSLVDALEKP